MSTVTEPAQARRWVAAFPLDLGSTLAVHRRGRGDPTFRVDAAGSIWRTSLTPAGPGTLRLTARPAAAREHSGGTTEHAEGSTEVSATAWGPGADCLLDEMPAVLGALDRPQDFAPGHPLLRELAGWHRGWRIGRTGRVLEALVPAVLEQKVVGIEARRAWRLLLARFGERAPGPAPAGLRVFPAAEVWAGLPSWEWHKAGVESVRARTIAAAAAVAGRLEEITAMPSAQADARLRSLPGIGPWTSAETRQRACGDADAVSVGDYHLPSFVGWALAGRHRTDDAGMLELLAPYAGHRYRVTRLIEMSGLAPPRRGPRLAARDYRAL